MRAVIKAMDYNSFSTRNGDSLIHLHLSVLQSEGQLAEAVHHAAGLPTAVLPGPQGGQRGPRSQAPGHVPTAAGHCLPLLQGEEGQACLPGQPGAGVGVRVGRVTGCYT